MAWSAKFKILLSGPLQKAFPDPFDREKNMCFHRMGIETNVQNVYYLIREGERKSGTKTRKAEIIKIPEKRKYM